MMVKSFKLFLKRHGANQCLPTTTLTCMVLKWWWPLYSQKKITIIKECMEINKKNGVLTYLQIAFNLSPLWLRRTVETNYRLNGRYFQVITRWAFPRADLHQQGRPPFTVRLRLSRPPHPPLSSLLSLSLCLIPFLPLSPHIYWSPPDVNWYSKEMSLTESQPCFPRFDYSSDKKEEKKKITLCGCDMTAAVSYYIST